MTATHRQVTLDEPASRWAKPPRDVIVTVEKVGGSRYRIDLAHDEHDHDYLWLSDGEAGEVIRQIAELRAQPKKGTDLTIAVHVDDIARVAHEANRAWQLATDDPAPSPHWEDAPEWQRSSAVDGVRKALEGYGPEALHNSWCDQKLADGWTYGAVKDAQAKTHPCLVPYDELPPEQRIKDGLFHAIVGALTAGG